MPVNSFLRKFINPALALPCHSERVDPIGCLMLLSFQPSLLKSLLGVFRVAQATTTAALECAGTMFGLRQELLGRFQPFANRCS